MKYSIKIFDELPSTHLYLKEHILKKTISPRTFILAKHQTSAIGTHGRKWSSPKGESFALSFAIPSNDIPAPQQIVFFLAFVIKKLLYSHYSIDVEIKWPNDIYLQKKKLAGILVERIEDTYLIGIGLNLNQKDFPDWIEAQVTSLYQYDQMDREQEEFLQYFIPCFNEEIQYWKSSTQYFWDTLKGSWLYHNEPVQLHLSSGVIEGIFHTVDEDGAIVIKTSKGETKFYSGSLRPQNITKNIL